MAYPSSFSTPVDQQMIGPLSIPTYASSTALAADVSIWVPGQAVFIASPPQAVIAVGTNPGTGVFVCSSTSSTGYAGGGGTVWWVLFNTPGEIGGQSAPFQARAAALAIAAYTGSGTGVLTASANGLIGSSGAVDGVTLVNGDQIFIPAGLTNVTAKDSGPWTVTSIGGASAKWVLTRPYWFAHGSTCSLATIIKVGPEGTFYNNTNWQSTAAKGTVIDTTDCAFYVQRLQFQRKLVAGTLVLATGQPNASATSATFPVGVYSATQSSLIVALAIPSGTLTGTVSYGPANASSTVQMTAGYSGTAAGAIFALATAQATQTNDTSTLQCTLINF